MTTDTWLAAQPEPQRAGLTAAAAAVRALLPAADEATAYGLPAWQVDGTSVAGLACAKGHWSFVPFSGAVTEELSDRLAAYRLTKGSIKVPADGKLPRGLISAVVRARIAEISMVPDSKGVTRDFHANGAPKAKGPYQGRPAPWRLVVVARGRHAAADRVVRPRTPGRRVDDVRRRRASGEDDRPRPLRRRPAPAHRDRRYPAV